MYIFFLMIDAFDLIIVDFNYKFILLTVARR